MLGFRHRGRALRSIACGVALALVALVALQSPALARSALRFSVSDLFLAPAAPHLRLRHHTRGARRHARGKLKRDSDGDGLPNRFERRRSRTNPHRKDTDGDGLSDWTEVRRTKTNPRRADSDGDGFGDGEEVAAGSDPRDPASVPGAPEPPAEDPPAASDPPEEGGHEPQPPAPEQPGDEGDEEAPPPPPAQPAAAIWAAPDNAEVGVPVKLDGTASTGDAPLECSWSFESQSGSVVYQERGGCAIEFTFESTGTKYVRLTVRDGHGGSDSNGKSFRVGKGPHNEPPESEPPESEPPGEESEPPEEEGEENDPPAPPPASSGCVDGAVDATTASQVRSAVQGDHDVCVTADVGDVGLSDLGASPVVISTEGGSMGAIDLDSTTDLTIEGARFRSIEMRGSHRTKLLGDTIGGTQSNRTYDQLIFMPETNNDVRIEGNDIGWTKADDSGNTGYGCRCYGTLNRLRFVGNRVHDIAADGFQGVGGEDVLIDRNEIGPVGRNPGSSEHSDNIQITGNGPNLRITDNWLHHQGYYEGSPTANSGSTYIHGGETASLIYENNLIETAQGRTEICGLGTGGTSRSNITIRNNTWVEGGLAFTGFPGFEWDCDSGSGNRVERNIAVDPDSGFAQDGSAAAATFSQNIWGTPGSVTFDGSGNCTSANCNPAGQEPIGYRKPSGVSW